MIRLAGAVVVLCASMGAPAVTHAADEASGKRHWKKGQELYLEQKYLDAAHAFEAGYAAAPRPLFLLNIGHSYRRAGELAKAKQAYEKLLALQPDFPQRADVENIIAAIEDAQAAGEVDTTRRMPLPPPARADVTAADLSQDPWQPAAPRPALVAVPRPISVAPHAVVQSKATPIPADVPAQASDSIFRQPWFWVVVAGLAGAGISATVVLVRP